jgi:MarR family transcriptional regulator, lower aerobic nicotinate degradation pathway regulator
MPEKPSLFKTISTRYGLRRMNVANAPVIPEALASWPGYLLAFIAERATERFERALAPHGVKAKHASALALIDAEGPMSQRELGRRLGIDKSPMVGLIDDLERLGYATRRRSDDDRRVQALHLTAAGRDVLARVIAHAELENARTFGILDEDEREEIHALLRRLAEAAAGRR